MAPKDKDLTKPRATVILASSVDGKIADVKRSAARFGSANDRQHLEAQIADADAVLFGSGTLRAYGTTLRVTQPHLLQKRRRCGKPPQPFQIVCSGSASIDPHIPFFKQSVPRWLLTTAMGGQQWHGSKAFERVLVEETPEGTIAWTAAFDRFFNLGIKRIAVLGGGELVASLLEAELIDDLWLTLCPLVLGGRTAPTLVEGLGFSEALAPRLELLTVRSLGHEVFLHYRVCH